MKVRLNKVRSLWDKIAMMSITKKLLGILILLGIFATLSLIPSKPAENVVSDTGRAVSLISVAESSTKSSPLLVTGIVRAESEAQLRTESQGEVIGVYTSPGSFVTAGSVLAELRNSAERAAVAQAQAGLEAAEANLLKGTGGARDEDRAILEANVANAEKGVSSAKKSAVSALKAGFSTFDDAVSAKTDILFTNPESANPAFRVASSKSQTINTVSKERIKIEEILNRHTSLQSILNTNSDLSSEIDTLQDELLLLQNYLDNIISILNNAISSSSITPELISAYRIDASAARSSVNGAISSITGAQSSLNNAETALVVANENLERGLIGAQSEDVLALQAQVSQARAGLSAARANLARTLIITPISGTVNTLSLRKGDFVVAFSPAATVSNNNALEVVTYITEADAQNLRVGSTALVDNRYEGVVTSLAPGLDPVTKKSEVRIGVTQNTPTLTSGSSVRVSIERNGFDVDYGAIEEIQIPISALKIETNRIVVFTINEESKLVANVVSTGLVVGDSIRIEDGLTPTMVIVEDARGLREGQKVQVLNNI